VIFTKSPKSPFDVAGVKTKATTKDILNAINESRTSVAERIKIDCVRHEPQSYPIGWTSPGFSVTLI
jgi:hypothetical protein